MAKRILVVDDEPDICLLLRDKLEQCGYQVSEAADGEEAIRAVIESSFDLVITDIIMPITDGIETISYLRKTQPRVKIIAMSSPFWEPYLNCARGLGANRAFKKPFRLTDLVQTVDELLAE